MRKSLFFGVLCILLCSYNISYALPLPSQANYSFTGSFIYDNGSDTFIVPISGCATFSLLYNEEFPQYQYLTDVGWNIHLAGNEGLFTLDAMLIRDEAILIPGYWDGSEWVNVYDTRYEGFSETNWDSHVYNVNEEYSPYNGQRFGMIVGYGADLWDHEDNSNFLPSSMVFDFVDEVYHNSGRCEIGLQATPVPEPSIVILLSIGLAGLAWNGKKRNWV